MTFKKRKRIWKDRANYSNFKCTVVIINRVESIFQDLEHFCGISCLTELKKFETLQSY